MLVVAKSIQPAEALAQRVEARAFGDQRVEVEVSAGLDALGGDDDERARGRVRTTRAQRLQVLADERVAIDRT